MSILQEFFSLNNNVSKELIKNLKNLKELDNELTSINKTY